MAKLGRAFVESYPPLRAALRIENCICWFLGKILKFFLFIVKGSWTLLIQCIKEVLSCLRRCLTSLNIIKPEREKQFYSRLDKKRLKQREPLPYEKDPIKWSLTYHGGLILSALLYLFIYYVLVKHHTYISITVAALLMLAYMIVIENSHNIRSIIMLCLPIMFTNRGRALVFCCMMAIMVSGPLKNTQYNIAQLHSSLNCSRQYLIIQSDRYVSDNVIENVIKVENVIYGFVDSIRSFADEVLQKFRVLIQLAITVLRYIELGFKKLQEIINICNSHHQDAYQSCRKALSNAYRECLSMFGYPLHVLCDIVAPLDYLCDTVRLPDLTCVIPRTVFKYINETIGEELRQVLLVIENEFYVGLDIEHDYSYNNSQSKSYSDVFSEVGTDIASRFWYIRFITRVFNLVSLILVFWILTTATLYHMHYISELSYDNRYIDGYLRDIDEKRKQKATPDNEQKVELLDWKTLEEDFGIRTPLIQDTSSEDELVDDIEEGNLQVKAKIFLFPMSEEQKLQYLEPFSVRMNDTERSKLCVSSIIWAAIVGYIFFFVLLDYSLYQLINLIDSILKDILFTDDLPLIDLSTKSGQGQVIRYNRTHLNLLREQIDSRRVAQMMSFSNRTGSLSGLYRRIIDNLEKNIPDDVAILDSLEKCAPKPNQPEYRNYLNLVYLAIFTFCAVIVEAYALRARHCFANLYYPVRARKRAIWLYHKLLVDKPNFEGHRLAEKIKDARRTSNHKRKMKKALLKGK